ncbi:uncharacterized protein LOC117336018 [Pecten maximus]|uniref:uncharacterized protein LOC117336018 n=1 Tax=Pecten maximus TaxID=6579 RepID=UPI0014587710|nr:uncharacterized protein LOC117336018 [Pecten maximus]
MTLAHITTTSNHSYLYNLMRNSLPTLFVSPPSSVWVGAYRTAGGEAKWHGGCSGVDTHVLGGVDNSKEACFLLADSNTLKTESCSTSLPFLCQSSSLEINKCFTSVSTMPDVIAAIGEISGMKSPLDCYPSCVFDNKCVGFRHKSTMCNLYTLGPGSSNTKGILFMKDLLRTAVPNNVTASISDLQNICSTSVAAPSHDTSSITPTQTFSITPTKTFSSTILSTVSTSTSTLMDPSYLESSSPEPVTVMKTYSDSTPPLSSVFTSVNLEKTSLPTETETLSMSCSNCALYQKQFNGPRGVGREYQ